MNNPDYTNERALLIKRAEAGIAEELFEQSRLEKFSEKIRYTGVIILIALLVNVYFYTITPDYIIGWVVSTFVLLMVNPFILMLPTTNRNKEVTAGDGSAVPDVAGLLRDIGGSAGSLRSRKQVIKQVISEVLWNVFFINCQPLVLGFSLIFSINIIFALIGAFVTGVFALQSAEIIIFQSVMIIVFYAGIEYLKPYSSGFFNSILGVHINAREKIRSGWRQGIIFILIVAILAAISGIILFSALLLPGKSLSAIFTIDHIKLGWYILPLLVIFISQVLFVRYLQGASSKNLMIELTGNRLKMLKDNILPTLLSMPESPDTLNSEECDALFSRLKSLEVLLLKMEIYKNSYQDLFGFFPVYFIVPDLQLFFKKRV